jgi:hypothetical protein
MRFAVIALILLVAGTSTAGAISQSCYRKNEAVAEQGIRYVTEVMVMSDTCRNETYDRFALRNRDAIVGFQKTMMERFRRAGGGAQAKLDTFMTHIANESALRTGAQDIGQVCAVAVQFLATADQLAGEEFKHYVEQQLDQSTADYNLCGEKREKKAIKVKKEKTPK